jgi:hypothetical protein
MQHIASPLQSDTGLINRSSARVSASQQAHDQSEDNPQAGSAGPAESGPAGRSRVQGPDLSDAIERVLAWHRSRRRH